MFAHFQDLARSSALLRAKQNLECHCVAKMAMNIDTPILLSAALAAYFMAVKFISKTLLTPPSPYV